MWNGIAKYRPPLVDTIIETFTYTSLSLSFSRKEKMGKLATTGREQDGKEVIDLDRLYRSLGSCYPSIMAGINYRSRVPHTYSTVSLPTQLMTYLGVAMPWGLLWHLWTLHYLTSEANPSVERIIWHNKNRCCKNRMTATKTNPRVLTWESEHRSTIHPRPLTHTRHSLLTSILLLYPPSSSNNSEQWFLPIPPN